MCKFKQHQQAFIIREKLILKMSSEYEVFHEILNGVS